MRKMLIMLPIILLSCNQEEKKTPEQLEDERLTREYNEEVARINKEIDSIKIHKAEIDRKLEIINSIR
jgi:hypothetical protein